MTANGYIEIEIAGKKVGLKFNMYAFEQFDGIKGKSGNVKNFTTIIYSGMLGNCYAKQTEPEFSFEQISDYVDELLLSGNVDTLNKIAEVFENSQVLKMLLNKANKNGDPEKELKKKIVTRAK